MKKFLTLVCMITCIFGLTACGSEPDYTAFEKQKLEYAQNLAASTFVDLFSQYGDDTMAASFDENTAEEVEYLVGNQFGLYVDGNAFKSAIISFNSGIEEVGDIVNIGDTEATIKDDEIIVRVDVVGTKKEAIAEVIVTNDMFMKLKSAALNPKATLGDAMTKAALNTLIGMGAVFVVLILICGIISCFGLIPKMQAKSAAKKAAKAEAKNAENAGVNNAVAQIVEQETVVDEADDLELVAVIAAAIAASEGAASTDGFVVRSIRRRAF